ncbi:MAG: GNAT family N-acetyltransferase [Tatlockia sp.]|nr:GNAT family N-acetyltransferase [Tatlockia sp.]
MMRLEKKDYESVYKIYLSTPFFFPLIAAVLLDEQDGLVYVNNLISPTQIYVEHSFGFSQIFGVTDKYFEQVLEQYLFVDKRFYANKIRLYAPYAPEFILKTQYDSYKSLRQRLIRDLSITDPINPDLVDKRVYFSGVDENNISIIENQFGLVSRFWRNSKDFIEKSQTVVVYYDGIPASLCYAAARANNCAEIDVLTIEMFRNLGLAKMAANIFIRNCAELGFNPLWDCFSNNSSSMLLCKSLNYKAVDDPYLFFTINKEVV